MFRLVIPVNKQCLNHGLEVSLTDLEGPDRVRHYQVNENSLDLQNRILSSDDGVNRVVLDP